MADLSETMQSKRQWREKLKYYLKRKKTPIYQSKMLFPTKSLVNEGEIMNFQTFEN